VLPDDGTAMARRLYVGCEVWVNNPLRPLEACGAFGMKAALNGCLGLVNLPCALGNGAGSAALRLRSKDLIPHRIKPVGGSKEGLVSCGLLRMGESRAGDPV
jgi:hypothetical protein